MMGIATVLLGIFTTLFSFLAFYHTREKFRLDLYEKRWGTYEDILMICSLHVAYGNGLMRREIGEIANEQLNEARQKLNSLLDRSVRGGGYHRVRSLFGPEIAEMTKKLNDDLVWLSVYGAGAGEDQEYLRRSGELMGLVEDLPKIFEPYVYFGGFKAWVPGPWNRAYRGDRSAQGGR